MRTALIQLNVTDDPAENLPVTLEYIRQAVAGGAKFVLTPEVSNCISTSRSHQNAVLQHEEDDDLSLIHISEPTRLLVQSRFASCG